jgi:hypothetical protein
LPRNWRVLDENQVLERFLTGIDAELDSVHDKIALLAKERNLNEIPDKYLRLFAPLIGHEWGDDKILEWNRSRIRDALRRYSTKGTQTHLNQLITEQGGTHVSVQDNASKLWVLGMQGKLGQSDCVIMDGNYWHDGSFAATISGIEEDAATLGLEETLPAGTLWFFTKDFSYTEINQEIVADTGWFESQDNIIDGGYMFTDSLIPIDTEGLSVDMGTPEYPLPLEYSILQAQD